MSKTGIIGGSGLYEMKDFTFLGSKEVTTPYGKPSEPYITGKIGNSDVIFLPRHGKKHTIPPHMINYRANIWGFRKLGVDRIISVNAVGGIKKGLKPGNIVLLDQVLDMTRRRISTFYDGKGGVTHIDFTEPYCPEMQNIFLKVTKRAKVSIKNGGTYVAVDGPRLESAAEIRSFRVLGGEVVGMTGMPEAALARELEICYSGLSVVANYAAGITKRKLTVEEVMDAMKDTTDKIKRLLKAAFTLVPEQRACPCGEALKDARI